MKIQIRIKNVYGNELCYPVCEKAKLLVQLTGRKTFTEADLEIIKQLGYELELVVEKRDL